MAHRPLRLALLTAAIGAAFGGGILYAQPGGDAKPAKPASPTTPGGTTPAPAPTTTAPAPTTPAPSPTTPSPTTPAPSPTTPATTPTTAAPAPAPAPTTTPGPAPAPAPGSDLPDVTLPGEKKVDLTPREMSTRAAELIKDMEGIHRAVLEMQAAAKQAKDVIKLNCVNENLLAVKQLLNIADAAQNELDEAIARGDRGEEVHQFGQITIAGEKSSAARDEAQACIGEELHFVGKNDVTVEGPTVRHDPTQDGDNGQPGGEDPFDTSVPLEEPAYASPFMPL
ncbi:MAG TPA: hypothetical protein VHE35_28515 [Kofleriaceae bacterium]|nr:hypothetical protein [Kofleriaceae bacterium]